MSEDPLIGAFVDGRYRIDSVVGHGGFGTVYAAQHVLLRARVALKVPRIQDAGPGRASELIAAFLDEGRMLKELRHTNIVAALDVGLLPPDSSGLALPYLVLEWCNGTTLRQWLADHPGPRTRREAWSLFRPVVEAIAHAHTTGLAHRDLKPANVILEPIEGALVPRVLDFGIAKRIEGESKDRSGETQTNAARSAFTPKYAAPEQMAGLRSGPWTDVYSLALVLIEVLSGRPVFESDADARAWLLEGESLTPSKLGLAFDDWDAVLTRALRKKSADRFSNAREMLAALDASLAGTVVAPLPASLQLSERRIESKQDPSVMPASRTLLTQVAPPEPRRPWIRAAAILGGAALAAAGVLVTWKARTSQATDGNAAPTQVVVDEAPATTATATSRASRDTAQTADAQVPARLDLASFTPDEFTARAAGAGFKKDCYFSITAPTMTLTCPNGVVDLRNRTDVAERRFLDGTVRGEGMGTVASGRAFRYARTGSWVLTIAADERHVEALLSAMTAGRTIEITGREKQYPEHPPKAPARLSDWLGGEVGPRLHALGVVVTHDAFDDEARPPPPTTLVYGMFERSTCVVSFYGKGGADLLDAMKVRGVAPFAYALDGDTLIMSSRSSLKPCTLHIKDVLGDTRAETVHEFTPAKE